MSDLVEVKTVMQLCRKCNKMVRAVLTLTHRDGLLVEDKSVCDCGEILWNWKHSHNPLAPTYKQPKPKGQVKLF